jgi:twitching motility protein PilI
MSESAPFEILSSLAERARDTAIDLPSVQDAQAHSTGLGFHLLGQRFIVSMDQVSELMRVPAVTRVPGVKNFVLGVGNVRGRLMIVVDLSLLFGEQSTLPRGQRRVIAIEDEENLIGFVIDESHGMQHFPSDSFSDQTEEVPEMFADFVRGSYKVAGVEWPVMHLNLLASDPRLEKLAMTH